MGTELATYLVAHKQLTTEQANELLQRMVVQGGSFDTQLLESGLIDENSCLAAMGATFGQPTATKEDIDSTPPEVGITFPLLFAQMHNLVPHRFQNGSLVVLATTPPKVDEMDNLVRRLGVKVKIRLTCEARIHYALNKLYGLAIPPRFAALLTKLDGHEINKHSLARMKAVWALTSKPVPEQNIAVGETKPIDAATLRKELLQAGDRDTIIDLLLEATLTNFSFAALFTIGHSQISGWACMGGNGDETVQEVSIDLHIPSMLQTVVQTESPYLGRIPKNEVNQTILANMGRQWPAAAFLAPLRVGGKVVAILYGDTSIRKLSNESVKDLLVIIAAASHGLENVIRANKRLLKKSLAQVESQSTADTTETGTTNQPLQSQTDDAQSKSALAPSPAVAGASAAVKQLLALSNDLEDEEDEEDGWDDVDVDASTITSLPGSEDEVEDEAIDDDASTPIANINDVSAAVPEQQQSSANNCRSPELIARWQDVIKAIRINKEQPAAGTSNLAPIEQNSSEEATTATAVDPTAHFKAALDQLVPELLSPQLDNFTFQQIESQLLQMPDELLAPALIAIFPGQLTVDPFLPGVRLPVPEELSAVLALLMHLNERAAPVIESGIESSEPRNRFVAAYLLSRIYLPAMVDRLGALLYDKEAKVRFSAAYAMRRYSRTDEYEEVLSFIRQQLNQADVPQQLSAIQLLTQLRDPHSVPQLIDVLLSGSAQLITSTTAALLTITGQAFGNNVQVWQNWWQSHKNSPREYWLFEGMMHRDPTVRQVANAELMAITGFNAGFNAKESDELRTAALKRWQAYFANKAKQ